MKFILSILLTLCTTGSYLFASVPDIVNFTTKEYEAHPINYDFEQDSNGIIYIANAYRVMEYDGSSFRTIPLVAGKSAISLGKDSNGKIYVGSSSEFGYLEKTEDMRTIYHSLKQLIPGNKEIKEITRIINYDNAIYFSTTHRVFRYKNEKIEPIEGFTDSTYVSDIQIVKGELLVWQSDKGLARIKGLTTEFFYTNDGHKHVNSIQFIKNNYVIFGDAGIDVLMSNNWFEGATKKIKGITTVLPINNNKYLIGTNKSGLYIITQQGEIVRQFTTQQGLQDNYIRNLFKDQAGNIWIAYNNGIGIFKWNAPLQYITKSQGFDGMGYSGMVYNNSLYIGTAQGLYKLDDWKNGLQKLKKFTKVKGLKDGTINHLSIANGQLIICQAAETYALKNGEVNMISDGKWYGSWIWKTADKYRKNEAFVGTYEGVERYIFKDGKWQWQSHIKGFKESSRVLEIDQNGVIWAIQGNKGLYRVELNQERDSIHSVTNYANLYDQLNTDDFNDIFYLNNKLYVTTFKGVYVIDNDSLRRDKSFDQIKPYVERARKYDDNKIYGIYHDQPYLLEKNGDHWAIKPSSVSFGKNSLVGSAEFFKRISDDTYLIGTQNGFTFYTPNKEPKTSNVKCQIRNIEILSENQDSMLFYGKPKSAIELPYAENNLRFTFSFPEFGLIDQIIYQTRLSVGNSKGNWQNVKGVNYREFTNLKEGDYIFTVRAKKGNQPIGEQTYSFTVLPPWYKSTWANVIYFIIIIVVGFVIRARFERQAKKLKAEKEREIEIREKLHRAEKLEIELKNKDNELAYMALSYTQKKEMLASLENKLDALSKELEHTERTKVNSLKRTISSSIDDESNWQNFQVHFDQKNNNFFTKLKEIDGKLSESYLLFCSYVKMGKSNKEIAELLNISVAAVEKRKYRLKKKWGIDNDTSFTDYLREL